MDPATAALAGLHVLLSALLALHGLAYGWMALRRARLPPPQDPPHPRPRPPDGTAALPTVTVQVAVRNEGPLVPRALEAIRRLEWPRDRLEVQLLDDSDDGSEAANGAAVAALRADGLDARHLHRPHRAGFKAGALQAGLAAARGTVLVPLDVDFLPPPDLLRRLVPHLDDPKVACAQARWSSLNAADGAVTRAQDLALDGHFVVEQRVRAAQGSLMSFNATACAWRRAALEQAGGWPAATLTEDLDLATRAHLAGWRFVYLEGTAVPALLPPSLRAFGVQQMRWARGSLQAARLHTGAVLRAALPLRVRLATLHHLWHYTIHPLVLALVLVQAALLPRATLPAWYAAATLAPMVAGPVAMYAVACWKLDGPRGLRRLGHLLPLTVAGLGLTPRLAVAALAGLASRRTGTFVRTRKHQGRYRADLPTLAFGLALAGWTVAAGSATLAAAGLAAFAACCIVAALWP